MTAGPAAVLTFGGPGTGDFPVTVETTGSRILVGCGMPGALPVADAVVLLGSTLDHCGFLPELVAHGWRGPVYATPATAARVPVVLADAAQALAEEQACAAAAGWPGEIPAPGRAREGAAARAATLLEPIAPGTCHPVAEGIELRFGAVGREPGAAWAELSRGSRRVVVVPVLGSVHHPLLELPQPRPACDTLVLSSPPRRGDGEHYVTRFAAAVHRTVSRDGSMLIPVSAGLTEVVLAILTDLVDAREIPPLPVVLDSPAGLDLVAQQSGLRVPATLVEHRAAGTPLLPRGSVIVLAGTETASYGRVRTHLARMLPDPRDGVLLTGPVVPGTPAGRLAAGDRQVRLRGRYVPVRAEITGIGDFATTAGEAEFLAWAGAGPPPETAFVLGADAERLARTFHAAGGWCAVAPADGEKVLW